MCKGGCMNKYESKITINPAVMSGKPTIRGLRITVEQILKSLAANISIGELLEDYPELEYDDIKAALLFAVESINHQQVYELRIGA